MAEICLECLNKIIGNEKNKRKYIMSKELELCEWCGKWKNVVVSERRVYYMHKFRYVILPLRIIYNIIYVVWRILLLPYLLIKYRKLITKK